MASKNLAVSDLLDCYGGLLTEKQNRLVTCYYNDDLSLSEISENEGITRQAVRDGIKRAEAQLFDYEAQLGLCDRLKRTARQAEEICLLAKEIPDAQLRQKIIAIAENM